MKHDAITFTPAGVFIQPKDSEGFWFSGQPADLIVVLAFHCEIDITHAIIRVRAEEEPTR